MEEGFFQLRVIIHFTVSADKQGCLCELSSGFICLAFSANSEQLRNNSELEGTTIKTQTDLK